MTDAVIIALALITVTGLAHLDRLRCVGRFADVLLGVRDE